MMFYHIKNLQSTKTALENNCVTNKFYHIKNLQSTKTRLVDRCRVQEFYHIKNLQSTKTTWQMIIVESGFITLRIYKVLKRWQA